MIEFLVTALIACVVIYVVYLVVGMINLPAPIKNIVYLIIGVVIIIWLLQHFGLYSGGL